MKELTDIQIEMANDILSLIYRNEGEIRKSYLDKYIQKLYESRYTNYLQFNMKYQSLLKSCLVEEYKLVYLNNANIGITRLGKKVAADVKGIKGFIEKLDEDEKREILSVTTSNFNNIFSIIVGFITSITTITGFILHDKPLRYVVIAIASFFLGILISDPLKRIVKKLL